MAAYKEVSAFAQNNDLGLRSAATAMAVQRVSEAHRVRGLYP
jgi:glutamate dehydrogenase (NAD(P)+)